jgi:hypothetical protein
MKEYETEIEPDAAELLVTLVGADLSRLDMEIGKLVAERLEQVIGRLESVWKPVGATEGFEIVRRRLFVEPNAQAKRDIAAGRPRLAGPHGDRPDRLPAQRGHWAAVWRSRHRGQLPTAD